MIRSGDPLRSDLLWRIGHRGPLQMPPLATNYVDPHGYEILRRWIAELKPQETTSQTKAAADEDDKSGNDLSELRPLFDEETGALLLHERPSQHRSLSSVGRLFR